MKTIVTRNGRTIIAATIRKGYGLKPGDKLAWIDNGEVIKVIILPVDCAKELRGLAKGERLLDRLLAERYAERAKDVES